MPDFDSNNKHNTAREKFLGLSLQSTRKSYYPQLMDQLKEARESRRRLQLLTDNLPARISYVDSDRCYAFVNHAYEQAFNLSRENIRGRTVREIIGRDNYARMKGEVMEVVSQHFRPEFINRVDDVVVFHPLDRSEIRKIVDIQIEYLRKRLADREIGLSLSDAALDALGEAGFDPVYGARPLKRAIQHRLENPLAQAILKGEYLPEQTVTVDVADGELVLGKEG